MEDCICSSPSKIQSAPKPMRRIRRAAGSGGDSEGAAGKEATPWAFRRRYCTVRKTLNPMAQRAPSTKMAMN